MIFSGLSPDNKLPEIIELKNHPWFIGVQFHPEFKSRPLVSTSFILIIYQSCKKSKMKNIKVKCGNIKISNNNKIC